MFVERQFQESLGTKTNSMCYAETISLPKSKPSSPKPRRLKIFWNSRSARRGVGSLPSAKKMEISDAVSSLPINHCPLSLNENLVLIMLSTSPLQHPQPPNNLPLQLLTKHNPHPLLPLRHPRPIRVLLRNRHHHSIVVQFAPGPRKSITPPHRVPRPGYW